MAAEEVAYAVKGLAQENAELKQELAAVRRKLEEAPLKPKICEECKFYVPLHSRDGVYQRIGYCAYGRKTNKGRKAEDTCRDFEFGSFKEMYVIASSNCKASE